jgi:hypothetical protein
VGRRFPIDQYPAAATPAPLLPPLADFTSDGILDQITNGWRSVEGNLVTTMVVRPGRGDGTFGDPISSDAPNASYIFAVADFNGDGRLDVFAAAPANATEDPGARGDALLGRGDGTFEVQAGYSLGLVVPTGIGTGDIWGTGRVDVVVTGRASDSSDGTDTFVVLFNDGIWPNSPQLRIGDASVVEGNTGVVEAVFTVTLENGPAQPVTVQYAPADGGAKAGADYQAAAGTLTFAPGETSKPSRSRSSATASPNQTNRSSSTWVARPTRSSSMARAPGLGIDIDEKLAAKFPSATTRPSTTAGATCAAATGRSPSRDDVRSPYFGRRPAASPDWRGRRRGASCSTTPTNT